MQASRSIRASFCLAACIQVLKEQPTHDPTISPAQQHAKQSGQPTDEQRGEGEGLVGLSLGFGAHEARLQQPRKCRHDVGCGEVGRRGS